MDIIEFLGRKVVIRSFPILGPCGSKVDKHHPHYFCSCVTLYHHEKGEIKLETRDGTWKERSLSAFECAHIWKALKKLRLPQKVLSEDIWHCDPDCHHEMHIIFDNCFLKFHWTSSDEDRSIQPYHSLVKLKNLLWNIEPFEPDSVFKNFGGWE